MNAPANTQMPHVASVVSTVTGVLGLLVLPFVFGPVAVVTGVVGLVLSHTQGRNPGFALTGLILGLATIVAATVFVVNAFGAL